jgi:hypothetical protein
VEQRSARLPVTEKVAGSNPVSPANYTSIYFYVIILIMISFLTRSAEFKEHNEPAVRLVTRSWIKERQAKIEGLQDARENDPKAVVHLLIPASQHPLVDGIYPGDEFQERLKAAARRYEEVVSQGGKAEFFLTANRHHDIHSGQTDNVALYDAAERWLVNRGVPANVLHGKDWIDGFKPQGVYNGAAEIAVATAGFLENERFCDAEYFCSPGQVSRARIYALAYGLPLGLQVPKSLEHQPNQFHEASLRLLTLNGLLKTFDPYGNGLLERLTQDRIPKDANIGTLPELLHQYSDMPWYTGQAEK